MGRCGEDVRGVGGVGMRLCAGDGAVGCAEGGRGSGSGASRGAINGGPAAGLALPGPGFPAPLCFCWHRIGCKSSRPPAGPRMTSPHALPAVPCCAALCPAALCPAAGWGPRQYDLRPRWNAATRDASLQAVLEPALTQWRTGVWFAGVVRARQAGPGKGRELRWGGVGWSETAAGLGLVWPGTSWGRHS